MGTLRLASHAVDKAVLLSHLRAHLQQRINLADGAIALARSAFTSDTKSSAGDKHEVGRAMVQQELDKLEAQRANSIALLHELDRVPLDRTYERVSFGSLVDSDQGLYLIAIGLGAVDGEGARIYAISLASPIGQVLKDQRVGDAVTFNGKKITIKGIS